MKKILIIGIINLCFFLSILGQEWAPIGAKWYFNQPSSESSNYVTFESVKDSLINEKIVRVIEVMLNESYFISREYIRESMDSIFYYNTNSNTFHLLYNFSAKAGDTITVHKEKFKPTKGFFNNDSISNFIYRIISIDSIQIQNVWFKRQKIGIIENGEWNFFNGTSNDYYTVEKIGSLTYFFGRSIYIPTEGRPTILRCYNDLEIAYQNPFWNQDCDFLPTEISQNLIKEFEIYPNPFSRSLNISLSNQSGFVEVYDIRGLKAFSSKQKNNLFNIDLSNLGTGVYFVILRTDNKNYVKKVVKQ